MPAAFTFSIPRLTITAVIDILCVALIIYQLLQIVRGTRAAHVLAGILTVFIAYEVALRTGLEALRSLLASLAPYTAIAIIVLFQSEIRRTLARLGRKRLFGGYERPQSTDEILLALSSLARDHTGALIILERDIGLRTFIESGVRLDSQISRDLLLSIFLPGTPLHDGAVIIQKDRLAAAACFLPLSVTPTVSTNMGTRHRAGIGITEETDCLSLIVSEETGQISIAAFGEIEIGVKLERVDERINLHFGVAGKTTERPGPPPGTRAVDQRMQPDDTEPHNPPEQHDPEQRDPEQHVKAESAARTHH
jgi:diadenylate cyclase